MIGGIYCESNLGPIYSKKVLESVRQKFRRLVGSGEIIPRGETLDEQIVNYFYSKVSKKMSQVLSSWRPPANRGYYNRTADLTRSICLGVYKNGKLMRMYRFTGGQPNEKTSFNPSGNASVRDTIRMSYLGMTSHPDPATRAKEFLESYDLMYKKDFSIVIAATMPYAVRLEFGDVGGQSGGYALPVLKLVINRMLSAIYDFKERSSGTFYGYVFENGGRFNA